MSDEKSTDVRQVGDALLAKAGVKRGDVFVRVFEKYDSFMTYVLTVHKLLSWEPGTGMWVDVRVTEEDGRNECSMGSSYIYPMENPEVWKLMADINETLSAIDEMREELKKLVKKLEKQPSLNALLKKAAGESIVINTRV